MRSDAKVGRDGRDQCVVCERALNEGHGQGGWLLDRLYKVILSRARDKDVIWSHANL